MNNTIAAEIPLERPVLREIHPKISKVRLLMQIFDLSLSNVCNASGRAISRSQLHRILRGQPPSPFERRAIAAGIVSCLEARCRDSAYLFGE